MKNNLIIGVAKTRKNFIDLINNSPLPLCIVSEMLQNILSEVNIKAQEELQIELNKEKEEQEKEEEEEVAKEE